MIHEMRKKCSSFIPVPVLHTTTNSSIQCAKGSNQKKPIFALAWTTSVWCDRISKKWPAIVNLRQLRKRMTYVHIGREDRTTKTTKVLAKCVGFPSTHYSDRGVRKTASRNKSSRTNSKTAPCVLRGCLYGSRAATQCRTALLANSRNEYNS